MSLYRVVFLRPARSALGLPRTPEANAHPPATGAHVSNFLSFFFFFLIIVKGTYNIYRLNHS